MLPFVHGMTNEIDKTWIYISKCTYKYPVRKEQRKKVEWNELDATFVSYFVPFDCANNKFHSNLVVS